MKITEHYFKGVTFSDIVSNIQSQFKNTNNEDLLKDLIELFEIYIFGAWRSLMQDCFYLHTAKGDALDLWGYILGLSRYYPKTIFEGDDYYYFNFDYKRFFHLIFFNPTNPDYYALSDDAFRKLLLLLLQKQYIANDLPSLNAFLADFFMEYGGVRMQDSLNMTNSFMWFLENVPEHLKYYVLHRDVLPRAACLGQGVGNNRNRYFGFFTQDIHYNTQFVGAFDNTNFINCAYI